MKSWITEELKQEVKKIFEPRYKRELSDEEVINIAANLAEFTEHAIKFSQRSKREFAKKT